MKTKFQQSWQIFKASIVATLRYPKLLWFPFLTTVLTGLIALIFLSAVLVPLVLHHTGYHLDQKQHWVALKDYYFQDSSSTTSKPADAAAGAVDASKSDAGAAAGPSKGDNSPGKVISIGRTIKVRHVWNSALLFVVYFVSMFLATFFNVAFYSEIMAALNGKGVSLRRGLSLAWSRLPSIFAWSLMAGVVGWAIRLVEDRLPFGARLVAGLIGISWSVAAVFAIPVIIREQPMRNPIRILKQSALTLKRTWGEGLIGFVGFTGVRVIVVACLLVPLLAMGGVAIFLKSSVLMVAVFGVWVVGMLAMGYVSSVARNVYRCALYLYAVEGVVPEPYNQELLDGAWKVR